MFRTRRPGMVVHHRELGWIVYLGKAPREASEFSLRQEAIELVAEYRSIDYVPDGKLSPCPKR